MTIGTIEESRLRGGVLALDTQQFETQSTAVSLVPSVSEEGDRIEVLSGAVLAPDDVETWTLNIGLIQDFTDPAGVVEYLRANSGSTVEFEWTPNGDDGPEYTGEVKLRATTIGGEVNTRLTSEVEFPVTSLDSPTYPEP